MNIKALKKVIENIPDEAELRLVGYDSKTGKSTFQYVDICCNTEHQKSLNQLWISKQGLKVL